MITYSGMDLGLNIAALMICVCNIIYTSLDGNLGKQQNRVFILMNFMLGVNALCEITNYYVFQHVGESDPAFMAMRISQFTYFLCHALVPPLLFYYISFMIGRSIGIGVHRHSGHKSLDRLFDILPIAVIVATELFIAFNPLTEWCWFYDSDRIFIRAWGEYAVIYASSVCWIVASFILAMRSWTYLSNGRKNSIAVCFFLACSGVAIQLISKSFRVEILMEALGFSGALIFVENEDDRKNVEYDIYNAAAFELDMQTTVKNHIPVHILMIRNIEFDNKVNKVISKKINRYLISKAVSDYLKTVVKKHFIYYLGEGKFALALYYLSEEDTASLAKNIEKRFDAPFYIAGSDMILSSRIIIVNVPEQATSPEELVFISRCPISDDMTDQILKGDAIAPMIRRAAIENAIIHGLEQNSFEVYYQPTYDINKKLHGAEALLRMNDSALGRIYPDEFIPIAEMIGMIDRLDEFVLKEVCNMISSGLASRYGLECINVNLSVIECLKEGFADHVNEIVKKAGVPNEMINFEITESVAAKDYNHLSDVIENLKANDFRFSIDDYGTGYSNITSLFSLEVDIIKIDKSILWNAEKSELGRTLLKTSVDMIHTMNKKALAEGVETEAQIEMLRKFGCEYLQGFYFSKPLPLNEFIAYLQK